LANIIKISDALTLAFHSLVYISRNQDRLYSNSEIAYELGVSEHHLSKVLQRLSDNGILKSSRGPKGGYSLNKNPEEIILLEIFEAIEGKFHSLSCLLSNPICPNGCLLEVLFDKLNSQITDFFSLLTLYDVVENSEKYQNIFSCKESNSDNIL
jgi:Rrf2 family protein